MKEMLSSTYSWSLQSKFCNPGHCNDWLGSWTGTGVYMVAMARRETRVFNDNVTFFVRTIASLFTTELY
jgi:hypothetical protein